MPLLDQLRDLATAVRRRWAPTLADEAMAGRLRARQIEAVLRLTPMAVAANVLNVVVIVIALWSEPSRLFLVLWALGVVGAMALGGRAWWLARRRGPRESASPRAIRRAVRHAAVLGLLWAALPVFCFAAATPSQQLLVSAVVTGMMCAGGFALATVPQAGVAYVVVLGLGAAAALFIADLPQAYAVGALLLVYAVVVLVSVDSNARLFAGRFLAEARAEQHNEVIGLLLRDFEQHASDVLWEVDTDGRLRHVSPKLAALMRRSSARLATQPALHWLESMAPSDEEGQELLRQLRARFAEGAPFRDQHIALHRGAKVYCWSLTAKPLLDAAGRAIGWRGVATDVTASRRAHQQLSWLAHHDVLTGLANRYRFRARLSAMLSEVPVAPFALLCLDLDHFKGVNDTLGHGGGDELLKAVGARLAGAVRREDLIARLGGDEFAVLLPGVDAVDEAADRAQALLEALREPFQVNGSRVAVRCSIGIAMAPSDGQTVDALLNHADLALYEAKAAGRDIVREFRAEMAAGSRRRLAIEQALRTALPRGELRLVFQPQVDLDAWRVSGFEALLRWRHPELGEVMPGEFIPVAEESGLMPAIGSWVLHEACRQAAQWPEAVTVAVNVSPVQLLSPGFTELALDAAAAAGLAPPRLELEITESVFLRDATATMQVLHALRHAGIRIALDDFGTGYSALGYLRRFPFDRLKIDRSFVRELTVRGDVRAIVRTILGLTRTLGMRALAEGVEEPAQALLLERYGCEALQGFLVGRPIPAEGVPAMLASDLQGLRPAWHGDAPDTASLPL